MMVHLKHYNHVSKIGYIFQSVDSGHLAWGELVKRVFMKFNNNVNGDINKSFCR